MQHAQEAWYRYIIIIILPSVRRISWQDLCDYAQEDIEEITSILCIAKCAKKMLAVYNQHVSATMPM